MLMFEKCCAFFTLMSHCDWGVYFIIFSLLRIYEKEKHLLGISNINSVSATVTLNVMILQALGKEEYK